MLPCACCAAINLRARMNMSRRISVVAVAGVLLSALLLTGCPPRVKISDIQRDPGHYMNREITVAGRVDRSFGALGMGAFQIDDGTGKMWILSQNFGVPGQGVTTAVTGRLMQTATFGGKTFTNVLQETRSRK